MAKSEELKKESRIRTKKKSWYRILAPPSLGSKEIGETYQANAESALGRVVRANIRDVTGNPKDQNSYLCFRLVKAEGPALLTSLIGYELLPSTIKRMVRPGADRLDDQVVVRTKDGQRVVVKILGITLHKTKHTIHSRIRQQQRSFLREEMKKSDLDTFLLQLIDSKLRAVLKKKLDKIYPLRELAIKQVRLTGKSGQVLREAAEENKTVVTSEKADEMEGIAEGTEEESGKEEAFPSALAVESEPLLAEEA